MLADPHKLLGFGEFLSILNFNF